MSVAGAYWRGNNMELQTTKDLTEYLLLLEEAKRRDHRKLGKELELFVFKK
jgi:threonyl-tRNA synthetase